MAPYLGWVFGAWVVPWKYLDLESLFIERPYLPEGRVIENFCMPVFIAG
jgi:hypothetical protein